MLGCPVLGGHGQRGAPGTGHLQICKRTDLLVVEINTVSCCSHGSAMDPGHWPARGSGTPWIYRSVSGEYACLEKRFAAELWPARRPGPRVHQDPTWSKTIPLPQPPSSGDRRGLRLLGKGARGDRDAPSERKPRGGSEGRRGLGWAAPPESRGQGAAAGVLGRRRPAGSAVEVLPAGPPSYETHMLRRLRAGQGSRKPNEPRPPPYVSPPAYDAPHRTLPTKRPHAAPKPPAAKRGRPAPHGTGPAPSSGGPQQRLARLPQEVLGGWSYHAGSGSLGCRARSGLEGAVQSTARGGSAESLFRPLSSPDGGSHTLPRAAGGAGRAHGPGGWAAAGPGSAPGRQRLPSGWGFGYAPSSTGSARSGQREGWEQRGRPERRAPPSPRPAGKAPGQSPTAEGRSRHGGVFVIDATCVVIRAEYIPPPRREQVRLLGCPPPRDPASPCQRLLLASRPHLGASERAGPPPPSPGDGSLGQRAARILGLPAAELGLEEPQGACAQREEPLVGGPRVHGLPSPAASPEEPPGVPGSRETPGDGTSPAVGPGWGGEAPGDGASPAVGPGPGWGGETPGDGTSPAVGPGPGWGRETPGDGTSPAVGPGPGPGWGGEAPGDGTSPAVGPGPGWGGEPPGDGTSPAVGPGPGWGREAPGDGPRGGELQARPPRARPGAKRPALCTRDLREAVSRIRRHTAPDSDTDEEPEGPAPRSRLAWSRRPPHDAPAYNSSSLESTGSAATVVPAGEGGPPGAGARGGWR
ncbi:angiopoietin-related protein 7-like [Platysternon megacephalum]|uniref:Angiopoietin-related protein 7-like n=1 Tax=Platysternon megacephalum TaxID=55544 RepID=A0A4D9E4B0_9SAUR|nr:angiopoietin-related protein 7-like [Platysternon megacephalum]